MKMILLLFVLALALPLSAAASLPICFDRLLKVNEEALMADGLLPAEGLLFPDRRFCLRENADFVRVIAAFCEVNGIDLREDYKAFVRSEDKSGGAPWFEGVSALRRALQACP